MKNKFVCFIKDFLEISAFIILVFTILTVALGEGAGQVSSLFRLGNSGISVESLLQLFAWTLGVCLIKLVFLTDVVFKSLNGVVRYVLCFGLITILLVIFAFCFKWISNELKYWLTFLCCYAVSTVISIVASNLINKKEDKKLNDALNMLKEKNYLHEKILMEDNQDE